MGAGEGAGANTHRIALRARQHGTKQQWVLMLPVNEVQAYRTAHAETAEAEAEADASQQAGGAPAQTEESWAKLLLDDNERVLRADEMRTILQGEGWGRVLAGIPNVQLAVELSEGSGFELSVGVAAAEGESESGVVVTYPVGGLGSDGTEKYTHAWTEEDLGEYGDDLEEGHRWCVVVPSTWPRGGGRARDCQ